MDFTELQGAIVFDIPLLKEEFSIVSGPHSGSMMRSLADSLERDVKNFFPHNYDETHVYKLLEFLRRLEKY